MSQSLEDQIAGRCIHFNGIMNKQCKKGVEYDSFGKVKIKVIPCIAGGTGTCAHCEFPTIEKVKQDLAQMLGESAKALTLMIRAKDHFKTTQEQTAVFDCPLGDHKARYTRVASNGHFWVACKTCQLMLNE